MRASLSALAAMASLLGPALAAPPAVIFHVIVDDLGWGDVSWHRPDGGVPEHQTPNLAALVKEGVELDRHYVHYTCTPSRSSYMSGRLPVHVQLTLNNPEQPNAGVPRNMTSVAQKLKAAGYQTHVVGKWDVGMATPAHTPEGRGFDSSLIYFEHKVDYWTQELMQSTCEEYDNGKIVDFWDTGAPARNLNGTDYVEYIFRDRVLSIIENYDPSKGPLYLQYDPHVAHCPLQVPSDWLAKFNFGNDEAECQVQTPYIFPGSTVADYRCRNQYEAMVALLDEVLGNVTGLLKSKGLWENTLMVLHSDNGGPLTLDESGSNNMPLRGGKYSTFEGGVRATAFATGGYIPQAVRGTKQEGIIHVADWLVTYCMLAGQSESFCRGDPLAASSGLPPIDGLDVWPLVSGANGSSPRSEIPIDNTSIISGQWKYIGGQEEFATWQGWTFPNASSLNRTLPENTFLRCKQKGGCLFDVIADPTEHDDVAESNPTIVTQLANRLAVLSRNFYTNNETGTNVPACASAPNGMPCACYLALPGNRWNGFFGPYQL